MHPVKRSIGPMVSLALVLAGSQAMGQGAPDNPPAGRPDNASLEATGAATGGLSPGTVRVAPHISPPTSSAPNSTTAAPAANAPVAGPAPGATTSDPAANAAPATDATPKRNLNLSAPDVRTVMPPEELQEPSTDQAEAAQDENTVQVNTDPATPDVPGGFGALWWAMRHPSEAWRIFAPVE